MSSFYDLIYEVTETNYNVILMTVGLWCIFKKSKLMHVHIYMHPNNGKIHVPQQCSTISEGTDFSISRATNTKNVKDTKNPRKNKFQKQKNITTSAAKKTPVSDSPLQLVNAKCLVCVLRDYFDLCNKDFLRGVTFPVAANTSSCLSCFPTLTALPPFLTAC